MASYFLYRFKIIVSKIQSTCLVGNSFNQNNILKLDLNSIFQINITEDFHMNKIKCHIIEFFFFFFDKSYHRVLVFRLITVKFN